MTAIAPAIAERYRVVQDIAREAAQLGLDFYRRRGALQVDHKGSDLQDVVSIADKTLEELIRQRLSERFPEDGLLGEEGGATDLSAPYLWVIDPIDGTAPFLNGLHNWCVSIGLMHEGEPLLGAIMDPNHDELFHGLRGHGAFVNDQPLRVHPATEIRQGLTGLGTTHRRGKEHFLPFVTGLLAEGGQFFRNGSGALMTAYVAAGRLIGYYETLIHGWDCLAGLVLIREAGGRHNAFLRNDGLVNGNPLLVAAPGVYDQLAALVGPSLDG